MSEHASTIALPEELQTDLVYALAGTSDLVRCFAARVTGLYQSADGCKTWQPMYDSLELSDPLPTTSVVLAPDYDGETHRSILSGVPGGVLRSTDGGGSWFATVLDSPPPAVSALVISPNFVEDGVVLAATTEDGIFRSATHGSHWARWNFGLLDLNVYCLAISPGFAEDETLFAGVESGIFRSTNGGRAWREVELSIGYEPVISLALSPTYPQDHVIFAGTESQGLLVSEDGGANWTQLGTSVITDPVNSILLAPDFSESRSLLVLVENSLWLSRDGGANFVEVLNAPESMTAVLAPQGLAPGATLLIGQVGGDVSLMTLEV